MSEKKIQAFESPEYIEVFRVVEWENGVPLKTEAKGFAHETRPRQSDEVYAALSTRLTRGGGEITLRPWLG